MPGDRDYGYVEVIVWEQWNRKEYGYEVRWDGAKHRVKVGFVDRDTARKAAREWIEGREHWGFWP